MKKKLIIMAATIVAILSASVMNAGVDAGTNGEKGLVVGHAVEIATYVMKGLSEDTIGEMQNRASQGFPVGIIEEETNELWICVYRSNAPASGIVPGNEKMNEHLGLKVVAQGVKYTANGVNVIRFGTISEY
jgi:hypothetical protein